MGETRSKAWPRWRCRRTHNVIGAHLQDKPPVDDPARPPNIGLIAYC